MQQLFTDAWGFLWTLRGGDAHCGTMEYLHNATHTISQFFPK